MAFDFPPLDCHAHIDPTVTAAQVASLRGAQVFAMTRTLSESELGLDNPHAGIYWGVGAHPAVRSALENWSVDRFTKSAQRTFLVGEVGLDSSRALGPQIAVFAGTLEHARDHMISVHSSGRVNAVLDSIEAADARGVVLHWFTGDNDQIARAQRLGCFFSVNAAMSDAQLRFLPYDRVIPETDFPAARSKTRASKPGDIRELERRVVQLTQTTEQQVRRHWYVVLGNALRLSGAADSVPAKLTELVDRAAGEA